MTPEEPADPKKPQRPPRPRQLRRPPGEAEEPKIKLAQPARNDKRVLTGDSLPVVPRKAGSPPSPNILRIGRKFQPKPSRKPAQEYFLAPGNEGLPLTAKDLARQKQIKSLIGRMSPLMLSGLLAGLISVIALVVLVSVNVRQASKPALLPAEDPAAMSLMPELAVIPPGAARDELVVHVKRLSELKESDDRTGIDTLFREASLSRQTTPLFWLALGTLFHRELVSRGNVEVVEICRRVDPFYEKALALGPDLPQVLAVTASHFTETGRIDRGLELLERLAGLRFSNMEILRQLLFAQIAAGRREAALATSTQMVGLAPGDSGILLAHAELLFELERFEEAAEAYRFHVALEPDNLAVVYKYASLLRERLLKPEEALAVVGRALDRFPRQPSLLAMHAILFLDAGDYPAAAEAFDEALAVLPEDTAAPMLATILNGRGVAAEELGDAREAENFFLRSLDVLPDRNFEAKNNLAYLWVRSGRNVHEALAFAFEAAGYDPGNAAYLHTLGRALLQVGRAEEALVELEAALERAPDVLPELLESTGDTLTALGRREDAQEFYRRALALNPEKDILKQKDGQ